MSFLERINSPEDLKSLTEEQIEQLIPEIRSFLIDTAKERGGHLASNLGVVELTVALHRVFSSPEDHIIFDVGHQAYVHKLLTGRRQGFATLREPGGMSGFTLRRESPHDPFGAGHSSTSLSAALGFAEADRIAGKSSHTVAVIGDGAYTGGMAHEALNNCNANLPMVIVMNENGMSISTNKGAFARYLSRVRISNKYLRWKDSTTKAVLRIPLIGKPIRKFLTRVKEWIKSVVYEKNYFEELGLYYLGPIDGNNYTEVYRALAQAKSLNKTVVLHLKTVKGKGYDPAEESPTGYHSVSQQGAGECFNRVFAKKLLSLAAEDKRITAVTAAMGMGTGLSEFEAAYPDRYFDVGIAEEHAITFSAALAAAGLKPFAAIYSTFLQRGYDNLLHDLALQSLPAVLMIDRAGLSTADGATHHGIFDVSFLSHMPGMEIFAPVSYASLTRMLDAARLADHPVAIRYPNSAESTSTLSSFKYTDEYLLANFDTASPPNYIFITYGKIYERVVSAAEILQNQGINSGIIIIERLKPYRKTAELLLPILSRAHSVLYVEEGIRYGGAAEITLDELHLAGLDLNSTRFGISAVDDNFASPDKPCDLYGFVGLSPEKIAEKILKL